MLNEIIINVFTSWMEVFIRFLWIKNDVSKGAGIKRTGQLHVCAAEFPEIASPHLQ